jgi:N-acetylneuraminic acid mutarotase
LGVLRFSALVLVAACSSPAPLPDAQDKPWVEGPELPGPRLEPGVTAMGQRLVVLGGFDQNVSEGLRITSDVIALDPVMSVWTALHPAPVAWTHVNLAASSTTLYLLGGEETQQFIAKGETYALDTLAEPQQWRQLKAMPAGEERGAAGIIVAPPHIYLLGGASSTGALKTCLDYDITTDTWTMLPDLPAPRSHPATMRMADGTLIVAGGLATLDPYSATTDVWALPINAPAWLPRAAMPTRRGGCAYGVVRSKLVCAGGEVDQAALSTVESYDPVIDMWTARTMMPASTAGTQGAVIANRLYVPGGSRTLNFQPESSLYVFSPLEDF